MAEKAKRITEKTEIERLRRIYQDLPPNQYAVADGLIVQAARLRVLLDKLWKDLRRNGETELYQAIIKQLNELTPPSRVGSKLDELRREE